MRLIDADKLRLSYWVSPTSTVSTAGQYYFYSQDEVDNAPTIDAEPVRHGRWIKMSDADGHYYACSECGEELYREWSFDRQFDIFPKKKSIDKTQFCPHCGAKMDEVNDE